MKKSRSLMLVLLIALTLVVNPVMAKPKPPVDPYPAPVEQAQGEAYPAPVQGLSAPAEPSGWCDGLYDFFCVYFNGIYVAWVNHMSFNPDLLIILCTAQVDTDWSYCREMRYLRYDVYNDRNIYVAGPGPRECFQFTYQYNNGNWFYIIYAYAPEIPFIGAQYATLWEPNLYPIFCKYLPYQKRQG